jgi:trigger factor
VSQLAQELVNETVRVTVNRKPACKIEMIVHANAALLKQARSAAIKAVSKEVTLPGFRKGKAPDELIAKKFPNDVEKQTQKTAADLAFQSAQKLANIPVLNNNSPITFDWKGSNAEGAELQFGFETEPDVPQVDGKDFQQKEVVKPEVGEKQLEEAIRQMRFFYANWKTVEDRPIQEGDYIMIDLDTIDGETTQRVFNHVRFEVSKERMASWMQKLVIGAMPGSTLEGVSEVDDTATEAEKADFKPKNVRLTIIKVEEATLPELDDAFAEKVGAKNVEEMRKSIFDLLDSQANHKAQTELREQVNEFLATNYVFDLPQSLIDAEKKHRFTQASQDPKFRNAWQKMSQEERQDLDRKITEESTQAVRLFYISRKIVQDNKIAVTHKEVEQEAVRMYSQNNMRNVDVTKLPKEAYALALSQIILARAQSVILGLTQVA